jgi:DNA-binding NarL/FixJ family response regulator
MNRQQSQHLKILLLEDSADDAELVRLALNRADPSWVVERTDDPAAFTQALESFAPDVVLSDHSLHHFSALDALKATQKYRPRSTFLLVSGGFEEGTSECLKSGAADFVRKSDLTRLPDAIAAALESRAPLSKLSQRQLEVLQLLSIGLSTRQIAERLEVSVKTVETHRSQVMKRTGIRELASLVRYAIRIGLVSAQQ